uniref:SET domain-containing protein n=1 Tax=Ascaris lumbricoides TaxID=6252 RepID=A0A0M3I188_ASCLU
LPQASPAPIYRAAIQPPQAASTEPSKIDSAIPKLPKEIAKSVPEVKENLARTPQGDNIQTAQGENTEMSQRRKGKCREHRVKSPQGINGIPDGAAEEAVGTNAAIASSQQTPIAASGDTQKRRMPDAKTSPSLPTPALESKGGTARSARASILQTSKTSVADTVTFKSQNLEEILQEGDGQAAHKGAVVSVSGSGASIESKEDGDGRLALTLDGGLRLRAYDVNEPVRRRRKAVDKIIKVSRKASQSTIASDEQDVTLAERTLNEASKTAVSQVRKVRAFVKTISKEGLNGIRKSFIRCQYYLPRAATRINFDQNPTRVRYRGMFAEKITFEHFTVAAHARIAVIADVICIDQTRVILKCRPDGSDFIHASRIPIGELENQACFSFIFLCIIITQLPLENTVAHFWEMVWQEKAEAILLLLTADEWKNHAERLQLIPSRLQCLHLGNMTITMASQIAVSKNWTVYELGLTKDGRSRRIVWHHYSGWEQNKGGADIQIIWKIHSSLRKLRRPLICMSMAGAGRAGTYAAFEWAHSMHHDKYRRIVNVEECVKKVREYRMHSVQSLPQFEYIYILMLRHIFLVKKIRDDYMSKRALQRELHKCIEVEKQYFRENTKDVDDETEMTLTCC